MLQIFNKLIVIKDLQTVIILVCPSCSAINTSLKGLAKKMLDPILKGVF